MTTPDQPIAALCWARYPSTDRTARIVHCDLPSGHDGDHCETDTESTWPRYATGGIVNPPGLTLFGNDGCTLPPDFAERFKAAMATQRITVLPPNESERERAAYERGVAEGRRQATEGLVREWGVAYPARRWPLSFGDAAEEARAFADRRGGRGVVSRLVGPWEPTEQAASPLEPLIRVVPGMPADSLLVTSPRLDEQCRRRECDHVHEVVVRFDTEQGDEVAAHQPDNDTAHRPSADGAAPPSPPCTSASSDRIGTTEGSAAPDPATWSTP